MLKKLRLIGWLCRWRKQWGLTLQSVDCKYKVSFQKKLRRLGVTWRNETRLLVLHDLLFRLDKLTSVSIDEKLYRFNVAGDDKIGARRGSTQRKCLEKRVALLERWTGITASYSRQGGGQPDGRWILKWAVVFKGADGSKSNVRAPAPDVHVLYGPKGSVRTEPS